MMRQLFHPSLIIAGFLWFFSACDGKKICKYKPSPIFEAGLPHVQEYSYEVKGPQSREALMTDRGVFVEIYQEVCETTRQEYRFTVPGADFAQLPDSLWLKEASRQLVFLGSFSPKQASLLTWAEVLETARPQMRLAEDHEVERGIVARVDKIISPDKATLILVFAEKTEE